VRGLEKRKEALLNLCFVDEVIVTYRNPFKILRQIRATEFDVFLAGYDQNIIFYALKFLLSDDVLRADGLEGFSSSNYKKRRNFYV